MNPDAIYARQPGANPALPTTALTRMNLPGKPPARELCAKAIQEFYQALAGIPVGYNDHGLGHLGIAVSPTEYSSKSGGAAHVPPTNPGSGPTGLPATATGDQRDRAYRNYYIDRSHWDKYKDVESWAKQKLIEAIDDEYIAHLKDDMLGYQPVPVRDIVQCITDRYLKFNERQKEMLEAKLDSPYNGEPIDTTIARFNLVFKAFDTAGEPFTDKQKVSRFYRIISKYSMAKKAVEEWDKKDVADRPWTNMQEHFREWYDEKMADATSASNGFHGANLATHSIPSKAEFLLADTTEALKTNQAMMANMAKKSDEKDTTIAKLRAEVASLKAEIRVLRERRTGGGGGGGGGGGRGGNQSGSGHFQGQGPNLSRPKKETLRSILPSGHYCHTCGYSSPHPSHECPCPGTNHVEVATKYDPPGGSSRRN